MEGVLEVIETLRAETDAVEAFRGDGQRIGRGRYGRLNAQEVREGLALIEGALKGDPWKVLGLKEAMGVSDFPLIMGDVLDRELLGGYRQWDPVYQEYLRVKEVNDFRATNLFYIDGAEDVLAKVDHQTEYPMASVSEGRYQLQVYKYGRRLDFSWEASINDDLRAFVDALSRLGRAARRTEQYQASLLYVGAAGFNTAFFTSGNANIVTSNPVLSLTSLATALTQLNTQVDSDGQPIYTDPVHLVVGPALEITARNILNALQVEMTDSGGTAAQKLIAANWMKDRVRLHVDPYIARIATTNAATTWFLFADPNEGRPAGVVGFLRGNREPALFTKSPNAIRVGGGQDPADGDFETDTVAYKVRTVIGTAVMDPKAAMASNGSGS